MHELSKYDSFVNHNTVKYLDHDVGATLAAGLPFQDFRPDPKSSCIPIRSSKIDPSASTLWEEGCPIHSP